MCERAKQIQQHAFSALLFKTEETLVIVVFPLTVNVAKLQNNACITKHTQFPTERHIPATAAAVERTKSAGWRYKYGTLSLNACFYQQQ